MSFVTDEANTAGHPRRSGLQTYRDVLLLSLLLLLQLLHADNDGDVDDDVTVTGFACVF